MSKYNEVSQQPDPYTPNPVPNPDPDPTPKQRWWLFGLPILPFLLIWFIFPRTIIEEVPMPVVTVVTEETTTEVEVTRIVTEEVPLEVPVEVTRIVTEFEEITMTQEVPVEVTRVVVEMEEVEVTRVVTEYQPVEVTRVGGWEDRDNWR